jgi:hypothetical protein
MSLQRWTSSTTTIAVYGPLNDSVGSLSMGPLPKISSIKTHFFG